MSKFKIDHDGDVFVTYHKGYKITHPILSALTRQLRKEFKREFNGTSLTKNARKAIESK